MNYFDRNFYFSGHLNKWNDERNSFTNKAITYLTFSPNGNELLVNIGAEQIYLYDINNAKEPDVIYSLSHLSFALKMKKKTNFFLSFSFLVYLNLKNQSIVKKMALQRSHSQNIWQQIQMELAQVNQPNHKLSFRIKRNYRNMLKR